MSAGILELRKHCFEGRVLSERVSVILHNSERAGYRQRCTDHC